MKSVLKNAVSILLVLLMAFGAATIAFAASPQVIILDPPSETRQVIRTDKDKYAWGDSITFTVEVTNVGENVLYNVRVAPDVRHPQWFTLVTAEEDCEIETLQPEETVTVQIVFGTQALSAQERRVVSRTAWRDRMRDLFARWISILFKVNYPGKLYSPVRVGSYDQGFRFDVYYTNVQPQPTADAAAAF